MRPDDKVIEETIDNSVFGTRLFSERSRYDFVTDLIEWDVVSPKRGKKLWKALNAAAEKGEYRCLRVLTEEELQKWLEAWINRPTPSILSQTLRLVMKRAQ